MNTPEAVIICLEKKKEGVEERINLQKEGKNAKPYQVKQVRSIIQKYGLGGLLDV